MLWDIGRSHFSSSTENDFFRSCLEFLPDLVSSNESVLWLENLLGMSVVGSPFEQSAVTFRDGKFRDFVGFGDLKFESASDVHWYSQSKARHLKLSPQFWIKRILETKAFDVQGLSKLSQIEIVDGSVASIKVNSTKTITADLYFFCESPFYLERLLSDQKSLTAKERSQFAKMEGWTEVSLQLIHKGLVTTNLSNHILFGGTTEFEPTVGRFFLEDDQEALAEARGPQASSWVCMIPADKAEDMEYVASTLKNIKKQIKRAYPEAIDETTQERIQVYPSAIGNTQSAMGEQPVLSKVKNLWLASHLTCEQKDIGSFVEAAYRALKATGFDLASRSPNRLEREDPLDTSPAPI